MTPMGRLGEPFEIAAAVVYLASEAPTYITGATTVMPLGDTTTGGSSLGSLASAAVGHQISRQVVIKRIHRRLDGRGSAEPDEAVGPHEDRAAVGHAGLGRIELRICGVDNRNKFFPARAEMVQARCRAEHDQMVTRTPQAVAGGEALSR
jgi:hypothetical protein